MRNLDINQDGETLAEPPSFRIINDAVEHFKADVQTFDFNKYTAMYDPTDRESREAFVDELAYSIWLEKLFGNYRQQLLSCYSNGLTANDHNND